MSNGIIIRTTTELDHTLVKVTGRVDAFNCIEMEESLDNALCKEMDIRVNMKDVEFLCSSGIRILIAAYKKSKALHIAFGIEEPSKSVESCLGMTNLKFLTL